MDVRTLRQGPSGFVRMVTAARCSMGESSVDRQPKCAERSDLRSTWFRIGVLSLAPPDDARDVRGAGLPSTAWPRNLKDV